MKTETLKLSTSRGATTAHVALPDGDTTAAIILIQEWWGINDHIRDIAGRYAAEGFVCVAPDLFRGKLTKDSKEAAAWMQSLAIEDGMETIKAAIAETKSSYNSRNSASRVIAWAGRLSCAPRVRSLSLLPQHPSMAIYLARKY